MAQRTMTYGCLYLDQGERMGKVKEQIKSLEKEAPGASIGFDVIYGPGQEALADEYVERVGKRIAASALGHGSVGKTFSAKPGDDPERAVLGAILRPAP